MQTIQGNAESRLTSLVWGRRGGGGAIGRLLSSSVDGSVAEWDLFHLQQKVAASLVYTKFCLHCNFDLGMVVNKLCMVY
jgi:hypothetical protein